MASLLNMSGGSLLNKGLPYDAEIEYLESSRTQWIDTLITESQYIDIEGAYCNLGVGLDAFWGVYNGRHYLEHQYNGFFYSGTGNGLSYTLGNTRTLVSVIGNEVYINGSKIGNVQRSPHETAYTIPLFRNDNNANPGWYSKMRLWYFKIWDNNILVRDYIPVRVGNVGYLYDKVSKQLFGNAGTGNFILGPDKLPLSGVIDMGLPSGTLWAQGNIVKDANGNYAIGEPTDYGCYFSWGNIDGHNEGDGYDFNSDNYALTPGSQLTGDIPSDDALHDAAVARIGDGFHLPSLDQMTELFNSAYTTNEWTTVNGVNGRRVTSLINGNSVFFPAAGYYNGAQLYNPGSSGNFWSSSRDGALNAYFLNFSSTRVNPQNHYVRYYGYSVRAVHN